MDKGGAKRIDCRLRRPGPVVAQFRLRLPDQPLELHGVYGLGLAVDHVPGGRAAYRDVIAEHAAQSGDVRTKCDVGAVGRLAGP